MFSFFKTKKPSPSSSPESDPIPSYPIPGASNDFVIVDQRQGGIDSNKSIYPNQPPYPVYPNFDQQFGGYPSIPMMPPMPTGPVRPPLQHSDSIHHTTYVHDIPFKLSPELSSVDSDEIMRIQVDDILAVITSKMQLIQDDYDFKLEHSLLQEPETADAPEEEEDAEAEEDGDKEADE